MRRFSCRLLIAFGFSLLAIVLAPRSTVAQGGTVRGHVADSAGVAIAQAVVTLEPGGLRANTRDNGDYAVTHVPGGVYAVRVRRLGYVTPAASVSVAEGQTVTQNFTVAHSVVSLPEVAIRSRARHNAAGGQPVPGDVFYPAMIQAHGNTETPQIMSPLAHCANVPR